MLATMTEFGKMEKIGRKLGRLKIFMKRCCKGGDDGWWMMLCGLSILALFSRQIGLHEPPGTIWDEVHFGTFANHYLNRTFYHDVHPPLGKLLIAGMAWITGYNGTFDYQPGKFYTDDFNYTAMRSMMSIIGASLVPLSFLIVWEITFSLPASSMAAFCVFCDTFVHRLNTLILLDPPLLASMLASVYGSFKFHNLRQRSWSLKWWCWMFFTGVSLGTVVSVKYVGVFTVATVGLHTAYQLFTIAIDPARPAWVVVPHALARGIVLIMSPLAVYVTSFIIHFTILTKWSVNGGGFYHTKFFAAFDDTEYDNVTFPEYIHYGANLTIQSSRPLCGYLESWYDLFPATYTAPCQQVTTSTIRDDEALTWVIKKVDLEAGSIFDGSEPGEPILVRSGDHVMLTHYATGRSLRSHGHRAPITKKHYQICGYGDDGVGGPMETWRLEIAGAEDGTPITFINTDFRLKHYKMNCYLKANEKVRLPKEWSFNGAKEVTCTRNPDQPGIDWHINWNISPLLPADVTARNRTVGLWGKMVQQHLNMFIGNSVLYPSKEELERSARPWMWPTLWQVQTMGAYTVNGDSQFTVGMTNPFLTYLNLASLIATPLLTAAHSFCIKRDVRHRKWIVERRGRTVQWCWWLVLCWALHYLPFYFMSRVLYYHHYSPSYLFSCMITGVMLNWVCECLSSVLQFRWRVKGRGKNVGGGGKESGTEWRKNGRENEKNEVRPEKYLHKGERKTEWSVKSEGEKKEGEIRDGNVEKEEIELRERKTEHDKNEDEYFVDAKEHSNLKENQEQELRQRRTERTEHNKNNDEYFVDAKEHSNLKENQEQELRQRRIEKTEQNRNNDEEFVDSKEHSNIREEQELEHPVIETKVRQMRTERTERTEHNKNNDEEFVDSKEHSNLREKQELKHPVIETNIRQMRTEHNRNNDEEFVDAKDHPSLQENRKDVMEDIDEKDGKDLLPSLLLLLPASLLLVSYLFFFPLATHIKGTQFEPHPVLNKGFDLFYIGQLWPEFGYRMKEYETVYTTNIGPLSSGFLDNPDINATLYYMMDLNTDTASPHLISPAQASTFHRDHWPTPQNITQQHHNITQQSHQHKTTSPNITTHTT